MNLWLQRTMGTKRKVFPMSARFVLRENNLFLIENTLEGKDFFIEMPFHLHPNVQVQSIPDDFRVSAPGTRSVLILTDSQLHYEMIFGQKQPMLGWYSEHFGKNKLHLFCLKF